LRNWPPRAVRRARACAVPSRLGKKNRIRSGRGYVTKSPFALGCEQKFGIFSGSEMADFGGPARVLWFAVFHIPSWPGGQFVMQGARKDAPLR
ncbi:unnamed protein product, partial [Amoebophrya sp. A120]